MEGQRAWTVQFPSSPACPREVSTNQWVAGTWLTREHGLRPVHHRPLSGSASSPSPPRTGPRCKPGTWPRLKNTECPRHPPALPARVCRRGPGAWRFRSARRTAPRFFFARAIAHPIFLTPPFLAQLFAGSSVPDLHHPLVHSRLDPRTEAHISTPLHSPGPHTL